MGKGQRRDAGLAGGIPTQDMRPHMRLAHQSYAERGIAGRVGMRRSAAIRATCTGGQYRPRKPNTPLRKEVEREMDAPEGNLVIVERCIHERQHHFSCREYGWDGSAHILSRHTTPHGMPSPTQDGTQIRLAATFRICV